MANQFFREISYHIPPKLLSPITYLWKAGITPFLFHQPSFDMPCLSHLSIYPHQKAPQRLLIDVSHQVYSRQRGGIPRVVEGMSHAFLDLDQSDFCFLFVMILNGKLYTAFRFTERILDLEIGTLGVDQPVEIMPGDSILMLDCTMDKYGQFIPSFDQIAMKGGTVNTVINDILVMDHPEWFPDDFAAAYQKALPLVVKNSDRLFCVSQTTANAVKSWVDKNQIPTKEALKYTCFTQGADTVPFFTDEAVRPELRLFLENCRTDGYKVFLLLSTIEPRKGQDFALDAFERMWQEGSQGALIFMGRRGWKADALYKRIAAHPEGGKRFLFIESANDSELELAFSQTVALISPSLDEGFGLPLIEAALHDVPSIVSDISVYHEVAGNGAMYFKLHDIDSFCSAIREVSLWSESERKAHAKQVHIGTWEQGAWDILYALSQKD